MEKKEKLPEVSMKRVWAMNASEWYIIVIGCVCGIIQGSTMPVYAVIFGTMLEVGTAMSCFCN